MLTLEKLEIYKRYNGDIDRLSHSGTEAEKLAISDPEWYEILCFLQYFAFLKNEVIGDDYRTEMEKRLNEKVPNLSVQDALKSMA